MKTVGLILASVLALAAQDVRLPPYLRESLPNGIVLAVMQRTEVPLVTVQITIRGGVESVPAGVSGLADITAQALRRGTKDRTAEQFSTELDQLGATWSAGANEQATVISSEFLAKDFDAGMSLVLDAVLRPTFPQEEMGKLLAQSIDAAKAVKDEPSDAANVYFESFFFGNTHPYGTPADELTLAKVDRKQILDYHQRMYVGRNMIVVVAGDSDAAATMKKLQTLFADVPAGTAYQWKKGAVPGGGTRLAIVNKPDATQTQFRIGVPGIDRTHPERIPLWLVNTLFGGRFTSILNDELRVNTGLTYGASSRMDQNHLPGALTIATFTKTETTAQAIQVAIGLMQRLAKEGITAEQLDSAKAYVKGRYPPNSLETASQLASKLSEIELYDLTRTEVDELFQRIDAVTVEDANRAARKYYRTENMKLLVLGNADQFKANLEKYDKTPVTQSISEPGLRIRQ
jgi:predicted Zn-dependent peptidase